MSNLGSGTGTRAWLEAAKADGPSAAARAKIWGSLAGVGAGGMGAGAGSVAASKMLVGGTLLGAAATVGLAATLIYISGSDRMGRGASPTSVERETASTTAVQSASVGVGGPAGLGATSSVGVAANVGPGAHGPPTHTVVSPVHARGRATSPGEDALAREAASLDEARSALARGDARTALRAVRAARSVAGGQLLPEELTVEQQALRRLGKIDQADAVEADLKSQYPESALAR